MGNKIFITLGSQKFQFNRLLKAVDELCEKGTVDAEDVFAQIGYSDYLPKNFSYKKFLDRDEFSDEMEKANIVKHMEALEPLLELSRRERRL